MESCFISEVSRYFTAHPFSSFSPPYLLLPLFSTLEETPTESLHLLQLKDNTTLVLTNYSQLPQHSSSFPLHHTPRESTTLYVSLNICHKIFDEIKHLFFSTFASMNLMPTRIMILQDKSFEVKEFFKFEMKVKTLLLIGKKYGRIS